MTRRSNHGGKWRIPSDHIGAGTLAAKGDLLLVNTEYGVQALDKTGKERWRAELGSRCLGVAPGRGKEAVATCLDGLYVLDLTGKRQWGTHSKKEVTHEPVFYRDGYVLMTPHSLHFLRDWNGPEWRYDLRDALGASIQSVRLVDAFEQDGLLVLGAVDYDSGIGRVLVLDVKGQERWISEPGPISGVFPAGSAVFVWSMSGYGKFESRMSRVDGKEVWRADFAGLGAVHPDGSISMLVGSNESPTWDNWEYRRLSASGRVEQSVSARGHCPARPLVASDGSVYFTGYFRPLDPNESRTDYTSYFPLPEALAHAHKTGLTLQPSEFRLYFQRLGNGGRLEVLGEEAQSLGFSRPVEFGDRVVFSSSGELVGFPKAGA